MEKVKIGDIRPYIKKVVSPEYEKMIDNMSDEEISKKTLAVFEMDSLDIVELSMHMEREFKVSFSDETIGTWINERFNTTLGDIVKYCNEN